MGSFAAVILVSFLHCLVAFRGVVSAVMLYVGSRAINVS